MHLIEIKNDLLANATFSFKKINYEKQTSIEDFRPPDVGVNSYFLAFWQTCFIIQISLKNIIENFNLKI